jgi:hypothetical protein
MKLTKIFNVLEELRLLGIKGSIFRIYYELSLRSGIKKIISSDHPCVRIPLNLNKWRKERKKFFSPNLKEAKLTLNRILSKEDRCKLINIADRAIEGKILCFSKIPCDFGNPINWHYNPMRKSSWPNNIHWTEVMKYEKKCGDVKFTWEVNRFSHLYYIVRAYVLTEDKKYVLAFSNQLKSWEENNPYNYGVNWNSGQELAIRALAWIYALYTMGDDENFTNEDFRRLMKLLYLHALHIEENISYAYNAVHNNHLIGEALALYAIGTLFPYFKESDRWKEKGKAILEGKRCLSQFYNDGGYCQLSFNYQRLALHYYLWALRIAEVNDDKFKKDIYEVLSKSAKFLCSFMNFRDGRLPNWGANDGALLNPWTVCDYSDFRPLLQSLFYLKSGYRIFDTGPWDEELFWFFGRHAIKKQTKECFPNSHSFPVTGLHVLRINNETFALFRCGSIMDRFAQADQLHVDIFWKGLNVAIDGGSYMYNDEIQYHKYFMGTRSHNTVVVNGLDQMLLFRRFKWLYWTKAKLIKFDNSNIIGEHYGYQRLSAKILHKRKVEILNNKDFLIVDVLTQKKNIIATYDLHWLLNDFPYEMEKIEKNLHKIRLHTNKGNYYIFLYGYKVDDFFVKRAFADDKYPDGWQSRYYGERTPALSFHMISKSSMGAKFVTLFSGNEYNYSEVIKMVGGENAFTFNT